MNKNQNSKAVERLGYRSAFTLVEVIFVVTIVSLLIAIVLPSMSNAKLKTQKIQDASRLKSIVENWRNYTEQFGTPDSTATGAFQFVLYLSGGSDTGWLGSTHSFINDPSIYVASSDRYASKVTGSAISSAGNKTTGYMDPYEPSAASKELASGTGAVSLSYCFISGVPLESDAATTPIGFTRGLMTDGKWHRKYGLYGDKGGYVVFGDGHVKWFDGSKPAVFLKWDKSGYSNNIQDAVPDEATISSGRGVSVPGDASNLLVNQPGTGGSVDDAGDETPEEPGQIGGETA